MVRTPTYPLVLAAELLVASTGYAEPDAEPDAGPSDATLELQSASLARGSMDDSDSFHHSHWGFGSYRSPGLAFVLSLTPVPVDFGNLYAENTSWGIAYTSAELALGGSMLWVGVDHMCHSDDCNSWSDNDRRTMLGLVFGYVAVKLGAGIHATFAAEDFNARQRATAVPLIVPSSDGVVVGWQASF